MHGFNTLGSSNSAWAAVSNQRRSRPPGGGDSASFQDKLFSKLDADDSGGISADELKADMEASPRAGGQAVAQDTFGARMSKLDTDGSGDISSSATDPLATNGDGAVSTSERMCGALKEMTQSLMKAVGSNGDGQVNPRQAKRCGELLHQLSGSAGTSSGGADKGAAQRGRSGSAQVMADQVMQHDAQAALASASAGSRFSRFSRFSMEA